MVNVKRDGFHYVVASWSCLVAGREQGAWWLRVAGELWRLTWLRLTLRLYRRAIQLTGGVTGALQQVQLDLAEEGRGARALNPEAGAGRVC